MEYLAYNDIFMFIREMLIFVVWNCSLSIIYQKICFNLPSFVYKRKTLNFVWKNQHNLFIQINNLWDNTKPCQIRQEANLFLLVP